MRRGIALVSVLSLLLGACALTAPTRPKASRAATATAKAGAKPSPIPSPKPSVVATSSPKPTLLEGPTALLKGKVEIDAYYIVSSKAGTVIANNGASTISLNAGTLISDNGLGLISDNGLGLIANNGLGLIANNGAGLISNNAGTFRLLAEGGVALGTILPVKGMAVFPISLRTGEIVAKPVFTDAGGQYTLEVPEAVKGTIRIVARVPVAKADDPIAQDPRIQYNLVVDTGKAPQLIDEDSSIMSRYLRASFSNRFKEIMVSTDPDATAASVVQALGFDPALKSFLVSSVLKVNGAAKEAGVPAMTPDEVEALAQRVTDVLLSYVDVAGITVDPAQYGKPGSPEPALPGMTDIIRQIRDAATEKMTVDAEHFNTLPLVIEAKWPQTIKKPSDVCDFFVDTCMLSLTGNMDKNRTTLRAIGVKEGEVDRLNTISIGVLTALGQTLLSEDAAMTKILETIRAAGDTEATKP